MYSLVRPILFQLNPERAHNFSLAMLKKAEQLGLSGMFKANALAKPVQAMGLTFANPVGLAAGLDKNGEYIDALAALGFGFIEIGTVTPRPQLGNPKPRLFRLPEHQAIINRMGFNNKGVDYLVEQVKASRYQGVLGINIGKNKDTANEKAVDDYQICMEKVYAHADYITVNLSSPNTPGLRDLQFGDPLKQLLEQLKNQQSRLASEHGRYVPLALKIAPDMAESDIDDVASSLLQYEIDGLIATNTSIQREQVAGHRHAEEAGGLSGKPILDVANQTLAAFNQRLQGKVPIIGVGGVSDTASAQTKLAHGASLLQVYSGFIYQGPALIEQALAAFSEA